MVFNENTLRSELIRIWGEYGAHVEVYDDILRRLKNAEDVLSKNEPFSVLPSEEEVQNNGMFIEEPSQLEYFFIIMNLSNEVEDLKQALAAEREKVLRFAEWTDSFACRTKDGWMIIPSYKHFATTDELYNSEEYAQYLQTLKQPTQ